jgi:hypothetical protein
MTEYGPEKSKEEELRIWTAICWLLQRFDDGERHFQGRRCSMTPTAEVLKALESSMLGIPGRAGEETLHRS